MRRRRRAPGPRSEAGGPPTRDGPESADELEIERRWLILARQDPEEFRNFFIKYHDPVLAYIQARVWSLELAEDLLSETFFEAERHLDRFRFQGVTFGAWLFRIAKRQIARFLERRRRRGEVPFEDGKHDPAVADPIVDAIEADQDAQLLALCVRQLPDVDQDIVVLHHYQGLRYAQVAVIVDLSVENVRTRACRARRQLASLLKEPAIRSRLSREGRRALDEMRLRIGRMRVVDDDGDDGDDGDDEDEGRRP